MHGGQVREDPGSAAKRRSSEGFREDRRGSDPEKNVCRGSREMWARKCLGMIQDGILGDQLGSIQGGGGKKSLSLRTRMGRRTKNYMMVTVMERDMNA